MGKMEEQKTEVSYPKPPNLSMTVIPGSPDVLTLPFCAWTEHVDSSTDVTRRVQR